MKEKLKILPNWSKVKTLFLAFPTMENRLDCIKNYLELIYTIIQDVIKENFKICIICDKGKIEYVKKLVFEYKNLKEYNLSQNIEFIEQNIIDIWVRDWLSIGNVKINNKSTLIKATYNPRYALETCLIDDACGRKIAEKYSKEHFITCPFILDGGNVIVNDKYILCTEELFIENYKSFTIEQIKQYFEDNFEQKLIILPKDPISPISHVDSIVQFIDNETVLLPSYPDSVEYRVDEKYISEVYKILKENLDINTKYLFIPSDLSEEIHDCIFSDAYNYINFLRINDNIYMPSFKDGQDYEREILKIFKKNLPNINLNFVPCDEIASKGGCFSCVTNCLYE